MRMMVRIVMDDGEDDDDNDDDYYENETETEDEDDNDNDDGNDDDDNDDNDVDDAGTVPHHGQEEGDHWTSDKPDLYYHQPVLAGRVPFTMQI